MRNLALLVAVAGIGLLASPTFAADLPVPQPVATPPAAPDWTGPYVGIGIGGGTGTDHDSQTPDARVAADTFTLQGWAGDIYAGYNWQIDQYVVGLEGDITYVGLTGSHPYDVSGNEGTLSLTTGWQGSALGRAGIVAGSALFYLTAGVTAASATMHAVGLDAIDGAYDVSTSNTHIGGTIGIGIDYMLSDHLIARGAIKYTAFASQNYDMGDAFDGPAPVSWDQTVATIGLAYKF